MLRTEIVDKVKTRVLCSAFFFFENHVVCGVWKNMVEPNRRQMTIQRMRIACWLTKATNRPA